MTGDTNVLIIAFDGLDHELIREYGLQHIPQQEFGQIDNDTGIHSRNTAELFASFITGETHTTHDVTGLMRWENDRIEAFESWLQQYPLMLKWYGIRKSIYENVNRIEGGYKRWYHQEDLPVPALFDLIEDSESMFVPAYDRNGILELGYEIYYNIGIKEGRRISRMEFEYRKDALFDELANNTRQLLMCHFKYPDSRQDTATDDEDFEKMYHEIDDLAGQILAAAGDYDTIIFMSDHGLPQGDEHNRQAFYSCSHELFGEGTPHITDFHDLVMSLVGSDEIAEVDI